MDILLLLFLDHEHLGRVKITLGILMGADYRLIYCDYWEVACIGLGGIQGSSTTCSET